MIELLKRTMDGDAAVLAQMKKAKKFWEEFFEQHRSDSVSQLAEALSYKQPNFEWCFRGNRGFAKSMMTYTCLAFLYDEVKGFDSLQLAAKVIDAFEKSSVSLEVKFSARRAAELFNLVE